MGSLNRLDPRQSSIHRAHRPGNAIGTSPGICTITPYTNASLDYRSSWISADTVKQTKAQTPNHAAALHTEVTMSETRGLAERQHLPRPELPPPIARTHFLESNGLPRSLATNIPDHPTAIQVNGIRQERTDDVMCPGYVDGVNSYDTRTLCGNWAEERSDKAYVPSYHKAASGRNSWRYVSTYGAQTAHAADKVLPVSGSNALTMYTSGKSVLATGAAEASTSSNKETVRLGGDAGVDYYPGDARSASRPSGNYVNYQAGRQHTTAIVGGKKMDLIPYETSNAAAYSDPFSKSLPASSTRCDIQKPYFQLRDPARDSKSKMLCHIKADEYGCKRNDADYLEGHMLGFPVKGKQKAYNLAEYRARWIKAPPEVTAAGQLPCSEHRGCFQDFARGDVERTLSRPTHVGSWH